MLTHTFPTIAEAVESNDLAGIWESIALVGALSVGACVMTWRRKNMRSQATTHWAVLLSAHGGLVIILHTVQVMTHLTGALVITAMAERIIWDVSDGLAERIDNVVRRVHESVTGEDHESRLDDLSDDDQIGVSQ